MFICNCAKTISEYFVTMFKLQLEFEKHENANIPDFHKMPSTQSNYTERWRDREHGTCRENVEIKSPNIYCNDNKQTIKY